MTYTTDHPATIRAARAIHHTDRNGPAGVLIGPWDTMPTTLRDTYLERAAAALTAAHPETTHGEGRHPDPDHGPGDVVRLFGHPVQLPEPADGEFVTDVAVVIRATYTDRDSGDGVAFTCTDQTGGVLLTGILVTAADLVRRGDE